MQTFGKKYSIFLEKTGQFWCAKVFLQNERDDTQICSVVKQQTEIVKKFGKLKKFKDNNEYNSWLQTLLINENLQLTKGLKNSRKKLKI